MLCVEHSTDKKKRAVFHFILRRVCVHGCVCVCVYVCVCMYMGVCVCVYVRMCV